MRIWNYVESLHNKVMHCCVVCIIIMSWSAIVKKYELHSLLALFVLSCIFSIFFFYLNSVFLVLMGWSFGIGVMEFVKVVITCATIMGHP